MSTALIYLRQSRTKTYDKTISLEVQEEHCRSLDFVKSATKVEVYRDEDRGGGGIAGRRNFLRLLERLQDLTPADEAAVVMYDQSRSFRNTGESLQFFAQLEAKSWIEMHFVHGSFDRSPTGEFTWSMLAAAHTLERKMAAKKVKEAKAYQSSRGEVVGPLPYGLTWAIAEGDGREVVIDEAKGGVVRQMFEDYSTGKYSARAVAERLSMSGAPSPKGRGWAADTIGQMLGNIAYIGKTYSTSRRHKDGDIIDGKWPALISEHVWDAVQFQRRKWQRPGGRRVGTVDRPRVFKRLLVCSCGRRLQIQPSGSHVYYQCRQDGLADCQAGRVREDRLLPQVRDWFVRIDALRPGDFEVAVKRLRSAGKTKVMSAEQIRKRLEREKNLYRMGDSTEEEYVQIRAELQALMAELGSAEVEPLLHLDGLLAGWDTGDAAVRHELLSALFESLHLASSEIVAFTPRSDRAHEVTALMEAASSVDCVVAEREGFEPSNRVAPVTAFPVPRPRPD